MEDVKRNSMMCKLKAGMQRELLEWGSGSDESSLQEWR